MSGLGGTQTISIYKYIKQQAINAYMSTKAISTYNLEIHTVTGTRQQWLSERVSQLNCLPLYLYWQYRPTYVVVGLYPRKADFVAL